MLQFNKFILAWMACIAVRCAAGDLPAPENDLDLYLQRNRPDVGEKLVVPRLECEDIPGFKPITMGDLPDLQHDIEMHCTKHGKINSCGLLCTINYDQFESRKLEGERKIFISKSLTEFRADIEVKAFWQQGKAPLAVTLLGFGQTCDDRNARAWQADLYRAGNHVLSFDSLIRNNMNRAIGQGVAGNIAEEGRLTARIINAFLATPDPEHGGTYRDRISSVRLLGASYGGNIALQTLREPSSSIWPLDRVLVISTPVDFLHTTFLFDKYYREDRSRFGKLSLARLINGFTPDNDDPSEKELSLMRAGIGYSFHSDFISITKDNMERYMPKLKQRLHDFDESPECESHRKEQLELLKSNYEQQKIVLAERKNQMSSREFDALKDDFEARFSNQRDYIKRRMDDLNHWTFKNYFFLLCRPFWEAKGDDSDFGRLKNLMNGAPNFVQVVVSEDDPLNNPEDLAELKQALKEPQLLLLPHGGHLGFTGTQWFQTLMSKFFAK